MNIAVVPTLKKEAMRFVDGALLGFVLGLPFVMVVFYLWLSARSTTDLTENNTTHCHDQNTSEQSVAKVIECATLAIGRIYF